MGPRFSVARRLARLFASYAGQRPVAGGRLVRGARHRRLRARAAADLAWQPELWRRLTDRVVGPSPLECHAATVGPAAGGSRGVRPAGAALPVRPHPAVGHRDRPARRARGRARRPCLAAAPFARAVGHPHRPGAARSRGPPTTATDGSATRCSPASGATPVSCSGLARRPRSRPTRSCPPPTPARHAARPAAGRPRGGPPADRTGGSPAAARRPHPSRCTPATAPRARSTCCARCCSGCSPTIRRSSRATSW